MCGNYGWPKLDRFPVTPYEKAHTMNPPIQHVEEAEAGPSHNSQVAKNGNNAETLFSTNPAIKERLETYSGKPINTMTVIPGRKKSDILVNFLDGSAANIQLKSGIGNGRGWSADRRALTCAPYTDASFNTLLDNVCLKRDKSLPRPQVARPATLIRQLLCGEEEATIPTHFAHVVFGEAGALVSLGIATTEQVVAAFEAEKADEYTNLIAKRTCVHIGPQMYLQRKGGTLPTEKNPDHIQLKVKKFPTGLMTQLFPLQ